MIGCDQGEMHAERISIFLFPPIFDLTFYFASKVKQEESCKGGLDCGLTKARTHLDTAAYIKQLANARKKPKTKNQKQKTENQKIRNRATTHHEMVHGLYRLWPSKLIYQL